MKGLSTLVEVLNRGRMLNISPSTLRDNVYIIIFDDGSQANIDGETYSKLNIN